jgi:hypothetical protein
VEQAHRYEDIERVTSDRGKDFTVAHGENPCEAKERGPIRRGGRTRKCQLRASTEATNASATTPKSLAAVDATKPYAPSHFDFGDGERRWTEGFAERECTRAARPTPLLQCRHAEIRDADISFELDVTNIFAAQLAELDITDHRGSIQ